MTGFMHALAPLDATRPARPGDAPPTGEDRSAWPDGNAHDGFSKHIGQKEAETAASQLANDSEVLPGAQDWTADMDAAALEISLDDSAVEAGDLTYTPVDMDGSMAPAPIIMRDESGIVVAPDIPDGGFAVGRGDTSTEPSLTDTRPTLGEIGRADPKTAGLLTSGDIDGPPPIINRDDTGLVDTQASAASYAALTDDQIAIARDTFETGRADAPLPAAKSLPTGDARTQLADTVAPEAQTRRASAVIGQSNAQASNVLADIPAAATTLDPELTPSSHTTGREAQVANKHASDASPTPANLPEASDRAVEARASDSRVAEGAADDLADLPKTNRSASATASLGDSLTKAQTVSPALVPTPSVTPLSGLSERLVVSLTQANAQAAQAGAPVTLDRLPQTVVAVALNGDRTTLQIDPPELGRIQLDYQFDSQGRTVVTLVPESEAARAALADRIATITNALQQSLSGGVDVNIGDMRDFDAGGGQAFGQDADQGERADSPQGGLSDTGEPQHVSHELPERLFLSGTDRLHIRV